MTGRATLLVVQPAADDDLGRLAGRFGPVEVCRPFLGDPVPDDLAGRRGLLVLGGAMGAHDDDEFPYLVPTRALLAEAVRRELPVLGICLGAQLLAVATGGRVERGGSGLEVGLTHVRLLPGAAHDPVAGALVEAGGAVPAVHYHYDEVTELPPDAELLGEGPQYPRQVFRVGPSAWGVQYHPEVSLAQFTAWVEEGVTKGELTGRDPDALVAAVAEVDADLEDVAAAHAAAFTGRMVLAAR